jgi:two-component system chemotaxis sensor kinase CheA
VTLESACSQDEIEDVFMFVRDEMKLVITPLDAGGQAGFGLDMSMPGDAAPAVAEPATQPKAAPAPAPAARAAAPAAAAPAPEKAELNRRAEDKGTTTVRVQAERLDELMDRVGELVIAQARLSQIAHSGTDLAIKAIAEEIERLASGLRDSTMGVRMVPMGSLFGRFRASSTTSRAISASRSTSSRSARTPRWTRP